jgi:hypothetical protein
LSALVQNAKLVPIPVSVGVGIITSLLLLAWLSHILVVESLRFNGLARGSEFVSASPEFRLSALLSVHFDDGICEQKIKMNKLRNSILVI